MSKDLVYHDHNTFYDMNRLLPDSVFDIRELSHHSIFWDFGRWNQGFVFYNSHEGVPSDNTDNENDWQERLWCYIQI